MYYCSSEECFHTLYVGNQFVGFHVWCQQVEIVPPPEPVENMDAIRQPARTQLLRVSVTAI